MRWVEDDEEPGDGRGRVGNRVTLVVDTYLSPRNRATVVRVVNKLSSNPKLFLTTTHFHPKHAGGEPSFTQATILIRDSTQPEEMEQHGAETVSLGYRVLPRDE